MTVRLVRISTDDEVYRVNAVWLGPPKATFPWRARYVAWGVGIGLWPLVFWVIRQFAEIGFFSFAWSIVATIVLTRLVTSRISYERPLSAVLALWLVEVATPRTAGRRQSSVVGTAGLRVRTTRPRPTASSSSETTERGSPDAAA